MAGAGSWVAQPRTALEQPAPMENATMSSQRMMVGAAFVTPRWW